MRRKIVANSTTDVPFTSRDNGGAIVVLLCLVAGVSILLYGAVDTGTLVVLAFLSLLMIALWCWPAVRGRSLGLNGDLVLLPLLALGLVGLVQLLPLGAAQVTPEISTMDPVSSLSLDPYATRFFLARLFLFVVFFAASLTFINTRARLRAVTVFLIGFCSILAFYSILQRVEDPSSIYGLRQPAQAIPFGTYVNRHHFAALMEMSLGLSLGLLFAGGLKRDRWPFIVAAAAVMGIAIILTGSRGGMIGMFSVIGLIILTSSMSRHSKGVGALSPKAMVLAGVGFILLTVGLVLFVTGADPLLSGTGIGRAPGDISSGRFQFWQTALKIFADHPILGAGLDAFGAAYSMYDLSNGEFRVEQAHNDYLQTLADAGILGFACVAAFIYLLFRKGLTLIRGEHTGFRRGSSIGALAGCFGILVHSFFDFPLRTPANGFVFLLLATIAIVTIPDNKHHHTKLK